MLLIARIVPQHPAEIKDAFRNIGRSWASIDGLALRKYVDAVTCLAVEEQWVF